jgi:hypothetical protein
MTFRQYIDLFPTYADLAQQLGATEGAVKQMRNRDHVPARYWVALVNAVRRRGGPPITYELLAILAQRRSK